MILNQLLADVLREMSQRGFREPLPFPRGADDVTGLPILTWEPPLTAAEQADFDTLVALVRSGMTGLSIADYRTVRAQLPALRAVRQLTRNQFVNLTEAERARMVYDAIVADTILWLTLLRET